IGVRARGTGDLNVGPGDNIVRGQRKGRLSPAQDQLSTDNCELNSLRIGGDVRQDIAKLRADLQLAERNVANAGSLAEGDSAHFADTLSIRAIHARAGLAGRIDPQGALAGGRVVTSNHGVGGAEVEIHRVYGGWERLVDGNSQPEGSRGSAGG